MRVRLNVYFPPTLAKQIDELAIRRRISRSAIVEAAVCHNGEVLNHSVP